MEDVTVVVAQITGCEESEIEFAKNSGITVLVDLLDFGTGSSERIKEKADPELWLMREKG